MNILQYQNDRVQTKQDELKAKVLEIARKYLNYYDRSLILISPENQEDIKAAKKAFDEFEASQPVVYVFVDGGNIQGASATCEINFELFDKDNWKNSTIQDQKEMQTPEEWNDQIDQLTEKKEIKPIY